MSAYWYWRQPFLPSVGIKFENLANNTICESCAARVIDVEHNFSTRSRLFTSTFIRHGIGQSVVALAQPFNGYFYKIDTDESTFSYSYILSSLTTFISISPLKSSFGFLFASDAYRVGIQYSDEKQNNIIDIDRQKRSYVFASFYL